MGQFAMRFVRFVRYQCGDEAAVQRLRRVCKLWPRVGGSQQSNILGDVRLHATAGVNTTAPIRVIALPLLSNRDSERLTELVKLWPELRPRKQQEILEYVLLVIGEDPRREQLVNGVMNNLLQQPA